MNKRYRIYFIDGSNATYNQSEIEHIFSQPPGTRFVTMRDHDRSFIKSVNLDHISHVEQETPVSDASAVVMPPTPTSIKQEEEDKKIESVSSLPNVLDKNRSEA